MTSRDPGRYDQIIHAARRLIARHGYRGTSLNMIAAEVGVSKAALYHHFPDKDTLYRSLIAAGMEHLFNEVRAGMQAAGDDPRERLYAFMRASVEYYERHHDSWMSGSQLFWTAESPEHRALVLTWRDAYETLLKDVLRDGVRGGQFRADTDVSLASKFLLSSLNQLSRWYRPGGGKSAREIMDRFVDMFLHGVQTLAERLQSPRRTRAGTKPARRFQVSRPSVPCSSAPYQMARAPRAGGVAALNSHCAMRACISSMTPSAR